MLDDELYGLVLSDGRRSDISALFVEFADEASGTDDLCGDGRLGLEAGNDSSGIGSCVIDLEAAGDSGSIVIGE